MLGRACDSRVRVELGTEVSKAVGVHVWSAKRIGRRQVALAHRVAVGRAAAQVPFPSPGASSPLDMHSSGRGSRDATSDAPSW